MYCDLHLAALSDSSAQQAIITALSLGYSCVAAVSATGAGGKGLALPGDAEALGGSAPLQLAPRPPLASCLSRLNLVASEPLQAQQLGQADGARYDLISIIPRAERVLQQVHLPRIAHQLLESTQTTENDQSIITHVRGHMHQLVNRWFFNYLLVAVLVR